MRLTLPPYLKTQSSPLISYSYSSPIATQLCNYKRVLRGLNAKDIMSNPLTCSCTSSKYCYAPAGRVITGIEKNLLNCTTIPMNWVKGTGDLGIVKNNKPREVLLKCPKYEEQRYFTWKQNSQLIMDSVEEYARQWAKLEDVEAETLSEWLKAIMSLVNRCILILCKNMSNRYKSVFDIPGVSAELCDIQEKSVVVPADKASNNIVFVCKTHYINCLVEELGLNTSTGNPTYTPSPLSREKSLDNHDSVKLSLGISVSKEYLDLRKLFWVPKLHNNPYKQRYIAGSARCSTKSLSQILTRIFTAVKEEFQRYCSITFARSGVNQMWILKISKELLDNLKSQAFLKINSIKSFDFTTLYTTIKA